MAIPYESGLGQLEDNYEPEGDEDESQINQYHQAADAPRVRTKL